MEQLDQAVHRITKMFIKFGLYDKPLPWNFSANVTSEDHTKFAQKGAEESTILLKNNATLPLDKTKGQMLLVLGDAASYPVIAGGGSGVVHYTEIVPPIWALADELEIPRENFPLDSIVSYGCNKDKSSCMGYVGVIHTTTQTQDNSAELDEENQINLESISQMDYDATLVFGGVFSSEGGDRDNLGWKSSVLEALTKFPKKGKVIGALTAPGPILLSDLNKAADAILFNIMPGQEYAKALMNIIFGRVNPSAKLSFTMPNVENEQQMSEAQYPGTDGHLNSSYSEKHHFGYRWYDQNKVKPLFEFGFGLSYTKFQYSALKVDNRTVTLNVKNTGKMAGSEIVQVYLGVPETENFKDGYRSPKALKSFFKVKDLQPGEEKEIKFFMKDRYFSYWNVDKQEWTMEPGTYNVMVGASSRDIRMHTTMKI